MIIKRCYVPFCKLKETDQEAIEFFDKVFNETYLWLSGKEKDMEYQKLISQSLCQLDLENEFSKFIEVPTLKFLTSITVEAKSFFTNVTS